MASGPRARVDCRSGLVSVHRAGSRARRRRHSIVRHQTSRALPDPSRGAGASVISARVFFWEGSRVCLGWSCKAQQPGLLRRFFDFLFRAVPLCHFWVDCYFAATLLRTLLRVSPLCTIHAWRKLGAPVPCGRRAVPLLSATPGNCRCSLCLQFCTCTFFA